jgi:hypothetical protein
MDGVSIAVLGARVARSYVRCSCVVFVSVLCALGGGKHNTEHGIKLHSPISPQINIGPRPKNKNKSMKNNE